MAAKNLLPGMGGLYTSELFSTVSVNSISTDTLDCSKCTQLSITLGDQTAQGTGTVQVQQTFTGGNLWSNFGSAITIASTGPITLFDQTDGPIGVVRFQVNLSVGTTRIFVTGFPLAMKF